jgi:hypothetical protein
MGNLYGFLGPVGDPDLVLISLSGAMQDQLDSIFDLYGDQFFEGVEEEIDFTGGGPACPSPALVDSARAASASFLFESRYLISWRM